MKKKRYSNSFDVKKVEEEKIKIENEKEKGTTKDASSKRDNLYTKERTITQLIIYQHLYRIAAQHRFKVGGVEGRRRLRGRLSDYNGRKCIWG